MTVRSKPKKYMTKRNYESFGMFLARARQAKELTQRDVSNELGYSSAQFVSNFERGLALPPTSKMIKLINIYGLDKRVVRKKILYSLNNKLKAALGE